MTALTKNALKLLQEKQYFQPGESTWEDICRRVSKAIAAAETDEKIRAKVEKDIYDAMTNLEFIFSTPCLLNANKDNPGQLSSCFVLSVKDNIESICQLDAEYSKIFQKNGGAGASMSALRPAKASVNISKGYAGGVVAFMEKYDSTADTMTKNNPSRKGAIKKNLAVWHPQIREFIHCKDDTTKLQRMNISVSFTDEFMKAVEEDKEWNLEFPDYIAAKDYYDQEWNGNLEEWKSKGYPTVIYETVKARDLFREFAECSWRTGEPGANFQDTMNRANMNKHLYLEINTNPCNEFTNIPYSSCNLGSINLVKCVKNDKFDFDKLRSLTKKAIRWLDNMITVNKLPLEKIDEVTKQIRPVGLGIMGLAEAFYLLKIKYNSDEGYNLAEQIIKTMKEAAIESSMELAEEKGAYPVWEGSEWHKQGIKIRNCNLLSIAPTGCQKPETLILTNQGILRLNELVDVKGKKWQDINCSVSQENGYYKADKGYVNGFAKTKKILLSSGIELESTYNHQYRVIRDNKYIWVRADEIVPGDIIPVKMGGYSNTKEFKLRELKNMSSYNGIEFIPTFPKTMNPDLAFLLGAYYANGSTHTKGIRFSMHKDKKEDINKLIKIIKEQFNYNANILPDKREKMSCIYFNSSKLLEWLKENNLLKNKSDNIHIPIAIRCSSVESLKSFIDGYFMCDGSKTKSSKYIDTTSYQMAQDLVVCLRAIGQNARIHCYTNREKSIGNNPLYRVFLLKYGSIGFKGYRYINKEIKQNYVKVKNILGDNFIADIVFSITDSENMTLDISVPENNCYIANNIVSHNTLSFIANTSGGCEPVFALTYTRRTYDGNLYYVTNEIFKRELEKRGLYSDDLMKKIAENQGSCVGIKEIPKDMQEIFVTAHDIKPIEHVKMVAVLQKYVDLSISKTINFSNNATVEDIMDIYIQAWKMGLKGLSIYRDGCRENQTLSVTRNETKYHNVVFDSISPVEKEELGETYGTNVKEKVACGNLYLGLFRDDKGNLSEIFINTSKGGICQSNINAISRLVSLALRSGIKVEAICDQLIGIKCPACSILRSQGKNVNASCPDTIGQYILEKYKQGSTMIIEKIQRKKRQNKNEKMKCPNCGETMRMESGCVICNCGFSKCG